MAEVETWTRIRHEHRLVCALVRLPEEQLSELPDQLVELDWVRLLDASLGQERPWPMG